MVRDNQMDGCLPCQNGTAMNSQTRWRCKGTAAPPPRAAPHQPRTPAVPPGDSDRSQSSETEGVPPRYVYIHSPFHSTQFLNFDLYAKDRKRDNDWIRDFLTDEGTSTGQYTICCGVMQLTSIL